MATSFAQLGIIRSRKNYGWSIKKIVLKKRREIGFPDGKRFIDMLLRGTLLGMADPADAVIHDTPTEVSPTPKEIPIQTIEELVKVYPGNITFENTTYNQQFFTSPLYPYFKFMNEKIKIFAVRVIQIWQYGGISYDLQASKNKLKDILMNKFEKVQNFAISDADNENSENTNKVDGPIISVDERALHLESKVPCHAFFGQLLMILRRTNRLTTVKQVMHLGIRSFCKHYTPELDYCRIYMNI